MDNWGKSVHVRGNTTMISDVSILNDLVFTGGVNSLSMVRISNASGDGLYISGGSATIFNVLVDNSSGKAIALSHNANAEISYVTLYGNGYGLVDNSSGTITLTNSIVWGNTTAIDGNPIVTWSDIEGGSDTLGNINLDPLFIDAPDGDFTLDLLSPCIDAGDTSAIFDGDSTRADMGAFPRLRQFLTGTSDVNINISADTTVIITEDFTICLLYTSPSPRD